jgi:LemA protein
MKRALIILFVVLVLVVAVSGLILRDYNELDMERSDIAARWAQLDKDMKGRANLSLDSVPNLDQKALNEVAGARAALLEARSKEDEMAANSRLTSALTSLQQSSANQQVQDRLADAAQNIAEDGTDYNDAIQRYNTDLQLFPKNITAALFRFQRDDRYFRTPDLEKKLSR